VSSLLPNISASETVPKGLLDLEELLVTIETVDLEESID